MNYCFSQFRVFSMYICTHVTAFSCWVGWDGTCTMPSLTCLAFDACYGLRHLSSPPYDLSFFKKTDRLPCMAISGQHHKNMNVEAAKPVKASFWKPHGIISTAFSFQSKSRDHSDSRWGNRLHLSVCVCLVPFLTQMLFTQDTITQKLKASSLKSGYLGFNPSSSQLYQLYYYLPQWVTWVFYGTLLIECLRKLPGILKSTLIIY